jgi:NADH:ubiquinone oxidoreductase subunit 5 (subunit L)/multisubunit Na+/H+ antiporter MnhA subunit
LLSGQWVWVVFLGAGALLSAAYVFRVFRYSFIDAAPHQAFRSLPPGMDLIAFLLAFSALALGLLAEWPLSLLRASGGEA